MNAEPQTRSTPAARVFLVDDHPLVRRGLSELLSGEAGLEVCGEATTAEEALERIDPQNCDLAIVDISLQGPNGLELIKRLRSIAPDLPILVYSMHDETIYAERALRAGARGYVEKQEPADCVVAAVRRVLDGHVYLSPPMTDRLLTTHPRQGDREHPVSRLTDRELEVFELLGRANGTRQIAEQLHLSPKTVESHRENIKRKLGLGNHNELMRRAVQWVLESR